MSRTETVKRHALTTVPKHGGTIHIWDDDLAMVHVASGNIYFVREGHDTFGLIQRQPRYPAVADPVRDQVTNPFPELVYSRK